QYGAGNQIQSFKVNKATTRTDAQQTSGKPPRPPSLTWSDELLAEFNPATGAMDKLEQWNNFRYEEGERRAKAQKATLIAATDNITLDGAARFWDPSGSTSADTIVMNQRSGDMTAEGSVNSTRLPEKNKKQEGLLSSDQPVFAKAAHMTSTAENSAIRYEGEALMWQGANRLQADRIDINRKSGQLEANGKVVSQLLDKADSKPKSGAKAPAKQKEQMFTVVRAPKMTYSDKQRIAHSTGGAVLQRASTVVNASEIRAFMSTSEQDSSLEKAVADGDVKIVQTTPDRTRTGLSQHAEYFPDDGRVILEGGEPKLLDTVKGETRGVRLTYHSGDDRLFVEGGQQQPVRSRLLRK
ncbi:MAG TPA: LptA/OstA family protein, partial [Bryobacteraceae bacterium]|nr:LptA/OstA family protein [Bryobacteraceae bacterium]